MIPAKQGLGRGERAPDFVLPVQDGTPTRFYAVAGGKPTVLFFCAADAVPHLQQFDEALNGGDVEVPVVAIKDEGGPAQAESVDFPMFTDVGGKVRAGYRLGTADATTGLVLDANLRVLEAFALDDPESDAAEVDALLEASLPEIEPRKIVTQAPVVLISKVLDAGMCEHLIGVWEAGGSEETGVEESHGAQRQDSLNPDRKRRRDHIVRDEDLLKRITTAVGRRVMPEVRKAFVYRATRFEGFKIACYEAATGGFFDAHRDNLSPSTAHRRFALTLNLNDDYEGGYLRFPEYGPHLYRPAAGEALVFSCSHLHEVTKVTRGRRFALLSFLFGEGDVRKSGGR